MVDEHQQFLLREDTTSVLLKLRSDINATANRTSSIDFCFHFVSSPYRSIVSNPVGWILIHLSALSIERGETKESFHSTINTHIHDYLSSQKAILTFVCIIVKLYVSCIGLDPGNFVWWG